uniref:Uncharacterized protein n=1 Tax=Vespula pensylvanica TaxID=30213 RepID=A0A834PBY0_VESPE|nr:hypothetical protein H0235_003339 [Vespula pensylvanica]
MRLKSRTISSSLNHRPHKLNVPYIKDARFKRIQRFSTTKKLLGAIKKLLNAIKLESLLWKTSNTSGITSSTTGTIPVNRRVDQDKKLVREEDVIRVAGNKKKNDDDDDDDDYDYDGYDLVS